MTRESAKKHGLPSFAGLSFSKLGQTKAAKMQAYSFFNAHMTNLVAKSEEYVAKLIESVVVIKFAMAVKRAEVMSLHQEHDEPLRTFTTRISSIVETCNFTTVSERKFGKKNMTNYTEEAIEDVMVAGIGDDGIRREVLSTKDIFSRSSFDIISFSESKEMVMHAMENSRTVSGGIFFSLSE